MGLAWIRSHFRRLLPERRAWARRRQHIRVFVLNCEDALDDPCLGWVTDLSAGGLALSVDQAIPETGSHLAIAPALFGVKPRWIEVEVRHSHPNADATLLGCQLLAGDAETLLDSFGFDDEEADTPTVLLLKSTTGR